mgnify:FL=1
MADHLITSSLSFDDVLLEPKYSTIESRKEIDVSTDLNGLKLSLPIVSSPMDTVTETEMLRAMDSHGGFGVAHRYNQIQDQKSMINGAKRRAPSALNVGAAIGVSGDYLERAAELIDAGATVLCLDIAHGHHVLMKRCALIFYV